MTGREKTADSKGKEDETIQIKEDDTMQMWKRILGFCSIMALTSTVLLLLTMLAGCKGDTGPAGVSVVVSKGTLTGTVTNNITGTPVPGVPVTLNPAIEGVSISTNSNGNYTASIPAGSYTVTYGSSTDMNYNTTAKSVSILAGVTTQVNVALVPKGNVVANAGTDQTGKAPGSVVILMATSQILDGSTATPTYAWTQTAGAPAAISNGNTATASVTLADLTGYKDALFEGLNESMSGTDATHPDGGLPTNVLDRFMVQGINPLALEEAETATFKVTVTVGSNTYTDTVNVVATLPFKVSIGAQSVPTGVPVLLHGAAQGSYNWSITTSPGAAPTLNDATTQNPDFTPADAGKYTLTESVSGKTVDVYAGTWAGAMGTQDAGSGVTLSGSCQVCHNSTSGDPGALTVFNEKFVPWFSSGHAQILTQNINNTASHWTVSGCGPCHSVGYDTSADNDGFDEAVTASGWTFTHGDPNNWTDMLTNYPAAARLANIQCENCHGPNTATTLHNNGVVGDPGRVNLSSDVCGSCHGEPKRHARYQQWAESGHSNFTLAAAAGMSTSCARCHSVQGFLTWLPLLEGGNPNSLPSASITWTADTVQPQTCVACHDPHAQGTTSGEPNTATVRVENNTPLLPAGFMATGVGRGAVCMTCHNTRNGRSGTTGTNYGLHEDGDTYWGTIVSGTIATPGYSAPHVASQADVLMGKNAYFVGTSGTENRGAHSFIVDTCTTCHMELTPPPAELSYNLAGTNHTFEASLTICSECHGAFDGGTVQEVVDAELSSLATQLGVRLKNLVNVEPTVYIRAWDPSTDLYSSNDPDGSGSLVAASNVNISGNLITAAVPEEIHGQQGYTLTLTSNVTIDFLNSDNTVHHSATTNVVHVQLGGIKNVNSTTASVSYQIIPGTDKLLRAGWNYFLVHSDGSKGVHNRQWTLNVLRNAKNQLP